MIYRSHLGHCQVNDKQRIYMHMLVRLLESKNVCRENASQFMTKSLYACQHFGAYGDV